MTTIPKGDREAARTKLVPLLPYLTRADHRVIADKLGNTTSGMVHQVAMGNRWTLDIYDELIRQGKVNKAKIDTLTGAAETLTPVPTDKPDPADDAPKTAEKPLKSKTRKKPASVPVEA